MHTFDLECFFCVPDNTTLRLYAANKIVNQTLCEEFAEESKFAMRAPIQLYRCIDLQRDCLHLKSALAGPRRSRHGGWNGMDAGTDCMHLSQHRWVNRLVHRSLPDAYNLSEVRQANGRRPEDLDLRQVDRTLR